MNYNKKKVVSGCLAKFDENILAILHFIIIKYCYKVCKNLYIFARGAGALKTVYINYIDLHKFLFNNKTHKASKTKHNSYSHR